MTRAIQLDHHGSLQITALCLASAKFALLTGSRHTGIVRCRRCRKEVLGVGDTVLTDDRNVVHCWFGYDDVEREDPVFGGNVVTATGVEILGSKLCRRDFTIICPECAKDQKIFVRR